MSRRSRCALILISVAWVVLLLLKPSQGAPLWFDEGWSLVVARTWATTGVYARPLLGEPISSVGMAQPPTATLPVGLSFRWFGVGIWQGRLPGLLFTLGAVVLISLLAARCYDLSVAAVTLGVLLLMMPHGEIHPVLIGRQALAEMPMVFYLLAGYLCFGASRRRPWLFLPSAAAYFGLALTTKGHVLPFWLVSLVVPLCLAVAGRKWRLVVMVMLVMSGSLGAAQLVAALRRHLEGDLFLYGAPMEGLYSVTALVLAPHVRLSSLATLFAVGQPTLFGIVYASLQLWKERRSLLTSLDLPAFLRLSLWTLTASWLTWYVMLSVGWPRYLFPPAVLGSVYVAALLLECLPGLDLREAVRHLARALARRRMGGDALRAAVALWLIALAVPLSVHLLRVTFSQDPNSAVLRTTDYLNASAGRVDVIETYDSELLFLLERPYHYPPDQVQVELNRRTFLGQDVEIPYDPLIADPDYLVVGRHSRMWGLYAPVTAAGEFELVATFDPYQVYRRVR